MFRINFKGKIIISLFLAFIFSGCFGAAQVEVVKVPVPCDVPKREKPSATPNKLLYLKEVLIYAEGLESDLAFCRGETNAE